MTKLSDAERIAKLPEWVRQYIRNLEGSVKQLEARIDELGRIDPSATTKAGEVTHGNWQAEMRLPSGDKVTFYLDDKPAEAWIRFRYEDGEIVVMASRALALRLGASNTMYLGVERNRVREKLLDERAASTVEIIKREQGSGHYRPRKS